MGTTSSASMDTDVAFEWVPALSMVNKCGLTTDRDAKVDILLISYSPSCVRSS